MPEPLTASATVPTATPERYAKQLASHLGRRSEIREEADGIRIVLTVGDCLLRSSDGALELLATASGSTSRISAADSRRRPGTPFAVARRSISRSAGSSAS